MSEHRVPLLGDAWRRHEDPATSRDPRIRVLVGQLSSLAAGPGPDPTFRAELRAQLVAITPRIVAESVADGATMVEIVPRRTPVAAAPQPAVVRRRRFSLGRVVGVATCLIVAFGVMLGGALMASRNALPGDSLYGLKRAAESFELATAGSTSDRAADYLDFAATRADEARQLITERVSSNAAGRSTLDAATVSLVRSTLSSGDSDVRDASRLLAQQAVRSGSATPLATMTNWVPQQLKRLNAISALSAVRSDRSLARRAAASTALIGQAGKRAAALITSVDCSCMLTARSDTLGPVPCTVCPRTTTPVPTRTPARSRSHRSTPPAAATSSVKPVVPVPGSKIVVPPSVALPSVGVPSASSAAPKPPLNLPTLPVQTVGNSPPVAISSCGIEVNLPILHTVIGTCPSKSP